MTFAKIDIDALPQWSPWPARLLGLETFAQANRTVDRIEAEYNLDKYAVARRRYDESGGRLEPDDLRISTVAADPEMRIAAVVDDQLVTGTVRQLLDFELQRFQEWLRPIVEPAQTVIELGSGLGTNLWALAKQWPGKRYLGADWSRNAVELGNLLYAGRSPIVLEQFDFYAEKYELLERAQGPVAVFTSQALEQLPSARNVIDVLARQKGKLCGVMHLEPSYELLDSGLLDLMRRRYIELNDYNRDLLTCLQDHPDVQLLGVKKKIFAFNPFNILSLYHWRPAP